jgi:hypothetical protein
VAFDVITPVRLGGGSVAVSPSYTTVRTTPALSADIVKCIDIANNATSTATVSVHLVAPGGSPDATNILIPGVSIPKKSIFQWSGTQVITAGYTIQATSNIAGVSVHASGGEAV